MPSYDFECKKCHHVYEALVPFDERGKYPGVACPECNSKRKSRVFVRCNILFKGCESGTTHDVRFGRKFEKAQEDRIAAQEASHMGGTPYNAIDDISSGEYFGEVK